MTREDQVDYILRKFPKLEKLNTLPVDRNELYSSQEEDYGEDRDENDENRNDDEEVAEQNLDQKNMMQQKQQVDEEYKGDSLGQQKMDSVEQSFHPKEGNMDSHQNPDYDEEEEGEDRLASMVYQKDKPDRVSMSQQSDQIYDMGRHDQQQQQIIDKIEIDNDEDESGDLRNGQIQDHAEIRGINRSSADFGKLQQSSDKNELGFGEDDRLIN